MIVETYFDRVPVFTGERVLGPLLEAFLAFGKTLVPGPELALGAHLSTHLDKRCIRNAICSYSLSNSHDR